MRSSFSAATFRKHRMMLAAMELRTSRNRKWLRLAVQCLAPVVLCTFADALLNAQQNGVTGPAFSPPPLPATAAPAAEPLPEPAAAESSSYHWPWTGMWEGEPVGSPKWWKKHKKKAEFEVGKGYK